MFFRGGPTPGTPVAPRAKPPNPLLEPRPQTLAKGPAPPMEPLVRSDVLRLTKVICQAFLEKSLIECEEQPV